jgi:branched-chain amino acid transport system ATP-binding protein
LHRSPTGSVIAGKPWLILLDEPAAGLTGDDRARMAELIGELNRDAAMIIVEHDMHFIRAIARTVTVFHQGRVLIEAPVETVLNDAKVRDVYLGRQA